MKTITLISTFALLLIGCEDLDDCDVDVDWEWDYAVSKDWIFISGSIDNTSGNTVASVSITWKIVYSDNTTSTFTFGGSTFVINLPAGKYTTFDESVHIGDKTVNSVKLKKKDVVCV